MIQMALSKRASVESWNAKNRRTLRRIALLVNAGRSLLAIRAG
jgi:hypothetical protein